MAASHVSATAAQTARAVGQSCDTCMTCSSCRSPVSCEARGAVALVALTLMVALPVAVVYVDIQVMALLLGDGGVHDRLGDPGQAGTALLGGQAREQGGIPCGERAWLPLVVVVCRSMPSCVYRSEIVM